MPSENILNGHTALITGASSGIGRAIALRGASAGLSLILVGRDVERLESVRQEAIRLGRGARVYVVDLADTTEVLEVASAIRKVEDVDIVIHSAGVHISCSFAESTVADFDRQYAVNLRAPFLLTQALIPSLVTRQGQVAFINSSVCLAARSGVAQYAATKHGLKALADSLREEVNRFGVRVFSLYAGRTATPLQRALYELEGREWKPELLIQADTVAEIVLSALAAPRTAEITDINVRPFQKG
jgi:short-subunit dehydrogenase